MADKRICAVESCDKPFHSHGYCSRHYYHYKAHGDPLGGRRGASPGEPLRWIRDHARFDGSDCLKWPFEITRWGYGTVKVDGRKCVASRIMCIEAHGQPPSKAYDAAHSCGNGHEGCVNPAHLSWATRTRNILDAVSADTWMKGELARSAKLTRSQVFEIRRLGSHETATTIAARYSVGASAISRILSGERWGWLKDG